MIITERFGINESHRKVCKLTLIAGFSNCKVCIKLELTVTFAKAKTDIRCKVCSELILTVRIPGETERGIEREGERERGRERGREIGEEREGERDRKR